MDIENCKEHEYVIGVEKGQIICCFSLIDVIADTIETQRVAFILEPCIYATEQMIRNHIRDNNINLGGVQRGKYI